MQKGELTMIKEGPPMKPHISRRSFLKGGLAAAGAAAASSIPAPPSVRAATGKELATLIDIRKCVGCGACVEACQEANAAKFPRPQKPFPKMYPSKVKVSDWSDKRHVTDRLTPYNWVFIQEATVNIGGRQQTLTFPRRCMHCQNPPCADLCPWGAASKLENGITLIQSDICLGGSKCKTVCPWHIPQRQTGVGLYLDLLPSLAGNGVMYKCDRCYQKIAAGQTPACIEACPEGVQKIGPREAIRKEAHELARSINGYIYGETENGGTNTFYISPVPFDELNKAIAKGDGRPHLASVENSMGQADNLALAMLIAPFAGLAAAAGKFYKNQKAEGGRDK
jgi:formate dehydrogenase iron-sulfur subunit